MKNKLWRGLSGVSIFLLVTVVSLGLLANNYSMLVNDALSNNSITGLEGSSYGALSDENFEKMIADSYDYAERLQEEGSVLLKNNGALPLEESERSITLFGRNSANITSRGVCGGPSNNPAYEVTLDKAFTSRGFSINETLFSAYESDTTSVKSTSSTGELSQSFYTDSLKNTFSSYSDAAIVTLSRYGGEEADLAVTTESGLPMLALDQNEKDLLSMIKESGQFKKTILLINSVYPLELGFLEEDTYGIDACLWIGNPGYYGLSGVVDLLTGASNPSGRTVDTFVTDSLASPAMQNFGTSYYDYDDDSREDNKENNPNNDSSYIVYAENIYVGYKYYETRYEDSVLSLGNATSSVGVGRNVDSTTWNYAKEVCYPFGYGLSYTTFSQEFLSLSYDEETDAFTATVKVTNEGDRDGKEVVQIWGQLPYTSFDIENGIEKSSIQVLGYEKVEVAAKQEVTVEVTFDRYSLACYDEEVNKGYILEEGDYYFALGNGAHEALNNILVEKTGSNTGLVDHLGNTFEASEKKTVETYKVETTDTESYKTSRVDNSVIVTNQFDDADINYWVDEEDKVTYLTRNDWQSTFPTKSENVHVNSKMLTGLKMDNYTKASDAPSLSDCTYDVTLDEKIAFSDMKNVAFDDPLWEKFISQMSISDLAVSMAEARGIMKVNSIQKGMNSILEGPEGIAATFNYGDKRNATGFPTLPTLAATWSHEMATEHGDRLGEEALYCGVPMINGVGANLHRTPYAGRASEYFSEDSTLTALAVSDVMMAMQKKGLIGNLKHCFLNEQEAHRQGISTFSNEQAIREMYLKPFEQAITSKSTLGIMTAYNRIGLTYSAAYTPFLQNVLRKEWAYEGMIITDALTARPYAPTADCLIAGINMFCLDSARGSAIVSLIEKNDDGILLQAAQESNHRILYALAHSSMVASEYVESSDMFWWQWVLLGIDIGLGVVTAGCLGMYVYQSYFATRKEEEV